MTTLARLGALALTAMLLMLLTQLLGGTRKPPQDGAIASASPAQPQSASPHGAR